ncbi:ABC transporter permease [Myxococcus sp. CA051A]|uniref:methionine ABC transporter permease n=1 Tax=unclassified Myxococcus TaxID=2648731 RepID=UPI00157A3694|nr:MULTISPECIES: methionine ABC transporter permease [unclassified Myxococcus]NTX09426.1 ABC transporter permease [Myxococcus sp. CA056]NTX37788.1 ABC transporter permease [Myxococcus sp. CA033]NTX52338.1 ABC transporter permease [Myxococcus sp. CA039A]NTX61156.1 ABC transporter permease [Myxococcus sp. CA051A]
MPGELTHSLWVATLETLYMTSVATVLVVLAGLPLGVLLVLTDRGGLWERPALHRVLGTLVNVGRSVPFIILMVAIVPLTRLLVGTTIGTTAAIVPLVVAAIPFMGRVVEQGLREVDSGLVEAAIAMGSTHRRVIFRVLIPEALPSLVRGTALVVISLLGYSAMAGAVGGGGLGDLAVKYGYMRFRTDVMLGCLAVLLALVQLVQWLGDGVASRFDHTSPHSRRAHD